MPGSRGHPTTSLQKELDHKIPEIHQALNDAATLGNWQNWTTMGTLVATSSSGFRVHTDGSVRWPSRNVDGIG